MKCENDKNGTTVKGMSLQNGEFGIGRQLISKQLNKNVTLERRNWHETEMNVAPERVNMKIFKF